MDTRIHGYTDTWMHRRARIAYRKPSTVHTASLATGRCLCIGSTLELRLHRQRHFLCLSQLHLPAPYHVYLLPSSPPHHRPVLGSDVIKVGKLAGMHGLRVFVTSLFLLLLSVRILFMKLFVGLGQHNELLASDVCAISDGVSAGSTHSC
jgi:hypothetical protein